jgi:ethanolamine ammonia-lyase small subunit
MTDDKTPTKQPPPDNALWSRLRQLTAARIGLTRSGASLATGPLLDFQLAHARARDAVHEELDEARLATDVTALGMSAVTASSAASDRRQYLMRPDLGRRLAPESQEALAAHAESHAKSYDLAFVVIDGLSARAVQAHAAPVLAAALPPLRNEGWRIAPVVIVRHGRVAIGDAVANLLKADCVAVLIGERPGLSAPDSMGIYLTWQPSTQTTDAERNCISNIRPQGTGYADTALKLVYLLRAMRAGRLSGVAIKDDSDRLLIERARED